MAVPLPACACSAARACGSWPCRQQTHLRSWPALLNTATTRPPPCLPAVAHGRFLLVCSASPDWQPPAGPGAPSASVVPRVERTTFHVVGAGRVQVLQSVPALHPCSHCALHTSKQVCALPGAGCLLMRPLVRTLLSNQPQIELDSGVLVDSHTILDDYVELSRSQGVHLRGQLLLVLGVRPRRAGLWRVHGGLPGCRAIELPGHNAWLVVLLRRAWHSLVPGIHPACIGVSVVPVLCPSLAAAGQPDAAHAAAAADRQAALPARHRAALPGELLLQQLSICEWAAGLWRARLLAFMCWLPHSPPSPICIKPSKNRRLSQDDDALVLAQHEERERRLRQQQRRPQHASGVPPAAQASQQQPQQQFGRGSASAQVDVGSGTAAAHVPSSGDPPAAAALAGPAAVTAGGVPAAAPAGQAAAGQRAAGGGSILSGLKQQLLAYLFREAQRQSAEAAGTASAGAEPQCAGDLQPLAMSGRGGSTASLLSAVAPAQPHRPSGLGGQGGSTSSLRGLGGSASSLGGLGSSGEGGHPPSAAHPHWRRPLDRFHYYFEAYAELLMWKVRWLKCGERRGGLRKGRGQAKGGGV